MIKKKHDIVISGSGMVGMVFALLMAKKKINVCLIDKNTKENLRKLPDNRTTAISQGSARIFKNLELWGYLKKNAQPILKIFASEGISENILEFDHLNVKEGPLGFIIDNQHIKKKLLDEISISRFITFYGKTKIEEIHNDDLNASFLKTNNGDFGFKLLVGADGRFSQTRFNANIKYYFHDYNQKAFVFNISHEKPHRGIALERFFSTGPMALLPIKDKNRNKSSVVWTVHKNVSGDKCFKKEFKNEFNKRYKGFFGKIKNISNVKEYALDIYSCYKYFNKNVVLIGDACQALHPIAGQGFNLGIRDADHLSKTLEDSVSLGLEKNNQILLNKYSQKRFLDKNLLVGATHNLNSLFSNNYSSVKFLRKLGLRLFSNSNFLKNQSMLFAMGLRNFEI